MPAFAYSLMRKTLKLLRRCLRDWKLFILESRLCYTSYTLQQRWDERWACSARHDRVNNMEKLDSFNFDTHSSLSLLHGGDRHDVTVPKLRVTRRKIWQSEDGWEWRNEQEKAINQLRSRFRLDEKAELSLSIFLFILEKKSWTEIFGGGRSKKVSWRHTKLVSLETFVVISSVIQTILCVVHVTMESSEILRFFSQLSNYLEANDFNEISKNVFLILDPHYRVVVVRVGKSKIWKFSAKISLLLETDERIFLSFCLCMDFFPIFIFCEINEFGPFSSSTADRSPRRWRYENFLLLTKKRRIKKKENSHRYGDGSDTKRRKTEEKSWQFSMSFWQWK